MFVSLRYLDSHHKTLHTARGPYFMGEASKTLQQWAKLTTSQNKKHKLRTSYCRRTRQICHVRKLAAEYHKLRSRNRPLSPDRRTSHPERSDTSRPPSHGSSSCGNTLQEWAARMRKRAQHEVLHMVLFPHRNRTCRPQCPRKFLPVPSKSKSKAK